MPPAQDTLTTAFLALTGAVATSETLPNVVPTFVAVPAVVDINVPPSVYQDTLAVAVVAAPVLFV